MIKFSKVIKGFKEKDGKRKLLIVGETILTGGINSIWRLPKLNDEAIDDDIIEMSTYDQQHTDEGIVAARNKAISLIGSEDSSIKQDAIKCYNSNTDELLRRGFANTVIPLKRRYIYIGETVESFGGVDCMDESKQTLVWFFDIERFPEDLIFQRGHPQPNTLYIKHPILPNRYYLREDVEDVLFEEQILEFIKLMRCLGATKISFCSKKGTSLSEDKKYVADIETEVGVKVVGVKVDPKVDYSSDVRNDYEKSEKKELLFSPKKRIYVPDDLVWYRSNQEWEDIVKARMEGSFDQFNLCVSAKQTNFVSKELDAKVKSKFRYLFVGVKGNFAFDYEKVFTQDEEKEWEFHVDFAPLDENLVPMGASSQDLKALIPSDNSSQTILDKKRKNLVIWILGGVAVALAVGLIIALL